MQAVLGHSLGSETLYTYRSDPSRTFGALTHVIAPSLLGPIERAGRGVTLSRQSPPEFMRCDVEGA